MNTKKLYGDDLNDKFKVSVHRSNSLADLLRSLSHDGTKSPVSNISDALAKSFGVVGAEATGAVDVCPDFSDVDVDLLRVDVRVCRGSINHGLLAAHLVDKPLTKSLKLGRSSRALVSDEFLELEGSSTGLGNGSPLIARAEKPNDLLNVRHN